MAKMRVVQVTEPKGRLELIEREMPVPGVGSVRVKIEACGICHSDWFYQGGNLARHRVPAGSGT